MTMVRVRSVTFLYDNEYDHDDDEDNDKNNQICHDGKGLLTLYFFCLTLFLVLSNLSFVFSSSPTTSSLSRRSLRKSLS